VATFQPYSGNYDPDTKTFTANWDNQTGGEYSNTYLEMRLNATEEYVDYFYARQTQSNVWFAWTFVNEIRGMHVLNSYYSTDRKSRFYIVDGTDAHVIIDLLSHKAWSNSNGSATSPVDWVNSHNDIIPSIDNVITIRLDYSEPQP
jgi:hypothetical protein